jgi:outer membrane lipoprotein-sorting protein
MNARILFVSGMMALGSIALAADKDVETLLLKMRNAYKSVKTAHIVTRTKTPAPEGDLIITSDVTYQAPDKIRAKLVGFPVSVDKTIVLTSNGKTLSVEGAPGGKTSHPFSYQAFVEATGPALNLETLNFWDWKRQLSTAKGDNMEKSDLKVVPSEQRAGKTWVVLEERAPGQGVYCRYFIDPATYFIHYVRVTDLSGIQIQMDTEIKQIQTNVKVDDSTFKTR